MAVREDASRQLFAAHAVPGIVKLPSASCLQLVNSLHIAVHSHGSMLEPSLCDLVEDAVVVHGKGLGKLVWFLSFEAVFLEVEREGAVSYFDSGVADVNCDNLFHLYLSFKIKICIIVYQRVYCYPNIEITPLSILIKLRSAFFSQYQISMAVLLVNKLFYFDHKWKLILIYILAF